MAVSSVERDAWETHERSIGWFASVCNWAIVLKNFRSPDGEP